MMNKKTKAKGLELIERQKMMQDTFKLLCQREAAGGNNRA